MKTAIRTSCTAGHLDEDVQRTATRHSAMAYLATCQATGPNGSQALAATSFVDAATDECTGGVCDAQ